MTEHDRKAFGEMISAIYGFHGKTCTAQALEIWWAALRPFDFVGVRDALGKHTVNPDTGQFVPKPADVVRMLGGSTQDAALIALAKVEKAVSSYGSYYTVVFDDPLIHRVIEELGGWVQVCATKARDWEFRRNEFQNRYRSYRSRSETPAYVPRLVGIFDSENGQHGFEVNDENVRLIGEPRAALEVMRNGTEGQRLGLQGMPMRKLLANMEKP